MAEQRPEVATKARVDHLERARTARALVDEIGEKHYADPLAFHGRNVGELQRNYLLSAAVDALIDIATTLRGGPDAEPAPDRMYVDGEVAHWSARPSEGGEDVR